MVATHPQGASEFTLTTPVFAFVCADADIHSTEASSTPWRDSNLAEFAVYSEVKTKVKRGLLGFL
jgi:hypothetical protein